MKHPGSMLPYLLATLLCFYLLPRFIQDTGTAMFILLALLPVLCFVCALVYGVYNSFDWLYAAAVAILFVPSIFIYYNTSAWLYSPVYGAIALAGNAIGALFYQQRQ